MTSPETAATVLQEHAVLWSAREIRAEEFVRSACDALVAGLDSPTLRVLAACTRAEATEAVRELLPTALGELGLVFYPLDSEAATEPAVRLLAGRLLAGKVMPRTFAWRISRVYGSNVDLALPFVGLHEAYDTVVYTEYTVAELDAEVIAEARRIAAYPHEPMESPSTSD
ncbi:hypothetical protein SAMN04487904_103422 [Actinopolyspora lacussalsi subsp. righensis]|uniref:Uncharacterized protein n=1 Tax=Actinopolyspora righensis TaxID=995060 RepID=A0A1I6YZJ0_9ACTN|nr:hypothetical protein [Actinopolyspora righensis]SFT55822.1 hypothetical protein SAMN04487904_103422 [Actinopolyspora righensis]